MKDAVSPLGKDDDLIPRLPEDLAPPALPLRRLTLCVGLLTLPTIGGRHRKQQQGEYDVHAHGPRRFLGRMLQTPLLCTVLDAAVLDQTAVVIIKRSQGLVHRGVGQEDGFPPGP